jgi:hypothetical protein
MKTMTSQKKCAALLVSAFVVLVVTLMPFVCQQRRTSNKVSTCYLNLRQIQLAKSLWAGDENNSATNLPTWANLRPYLKDIYSNGIPVCPAGGTYTIGRVDQLPTCSIGGPGHELPK